VRAFVRRALTRSDISRERVQLPNPAKRYLKLILHAFDRNVLYHGSPLAKERVGTYTTLLLLDNGSNQFSVKQLLLVCLTSSK
jgi:hypothetical protein